MPLAQVLQYSIVMGLSTDLDSLSYCAYYDSTIMAMETIIGNGCEIDGALAITQAELDSAREAGVIGLILRCCALSHWEPSKLYKCDGESWDLDRYPIVLILIRRLLPWKELLQMDEG